MSQNDYSEINLHITWHTKNSLPLLTPTVEPLTHRYIKQRLAQDNSLFFHDIGGTETHIHLVVSVQPTVSISDLVGQLKGASSHEVNQQIGTRDKTLQWQAGYGVVSFGTGDLDWVLNYVRNQREHHASGKTFERLERVIPMPEQDARERA
jgi:putative transposase